MCARIVSLLVAIALLGPPSHADAQTRSKPLLNACAGDQSSVSYWAKTLKARDPQLRVRAASALGATRSEAAVPALLEALKDENADLRLAAIEALGRIGREARGSIPALSEALTDTDPRIRSEAARALEKIKY